MAMIPEEVWNQRLAEEGIHPCFKTVMAHLAINGAIEGAILMMKPKIDPDAPIADEKKGLFSK